MASAISRVEALQVEVANLEARFQLLKQEVALAEVNKMSKSLAVLEDRTDQLNTAAVKIAAFEVRVAELERCKQEADKRQWQFVYIFAGGMATLLSTVVVQLMIAVLKK